MSAKLRVEGIRLGVAIAGWLLGSITLGFTTYVFLPTLLPHWTGDISRLSAVIVMEVYFLLIIELVVAMGGIGGTRDRLRVHQLESEEARFAIVLWAGAYVVAFTVYALLSAVLPAFPSASELARYLVAIGTDMGRLTGADIATVVFVPLFFLINALMPVKFLPEWLQVLARVNPLTYGVDATRAIMLDGWVWCEILLPVGVIVALDVVFGVAAVVVLARATNVSAR